MEWFPNPDPVRLRHIGNPIEHRIETQKSAVFSCCSKFNPIVRPVLVPSNKSAQIDQEAPLSNSSPIPILEGHPSSPIHRAPSQLCPPVLHRRTERCPATSNRGSVERTSPSGVEVRTRTESDGPKTECLCGTFPITLTSCTHL